MSKTTLNISIDEELKIKLKIIAIQEKKTVSEIIAELVTEYLDEHG
jgi:metal-responsive CopG/Arc/MetJ family transcriptional regulator